MLFLKPNYQLKSIQLTEYVIQICAENRILKSYASNFSTTNLSISINGIGKMSIAGLGHQIQLLWNNWQKINNGSFVPGVKKGDPQVWRITGWQTCYSCSCDERVRGFRGNKFDRVCRRDGGGVKIQGFHFQKLRRRVGNKGWQYWDGVFLSVWVFVYVLMFMLNGWKGIQVYVCVRWF